MRTRNRRVYGHRPVDLPCRVGIGEDPGKHPIPRPVPGITTMPLPYRLPWPELLARQITPRDPGPVPVRNALHHAATIAERTTPPPRIRGQQRPDPLPLLVREHPQPRIRSHLSRLPRTPRTKWETRPSCCARARCQGGPRRYVRRWCPRQGSRCRGLRQPALTHGTPRAQKQAVPCDVARTA